MHKETPTVIIKGQEPFDRDGNFIAEKAIDLALEQRALGDLDAADTLDLLVDFFSTSQNYIFNGGVTLDRGMASRTVPIILPGAPV
jgi:hypothetical protein